MTSVKRLTADVVEAKVNLSWFLPPSSAGAGRPLAPAIWRIYRREEKAFVAGRDDLEFFLASDWGDADLIREGELRPAGEGEYRYRDESVEVGGTYSYFVRLNDAEPVGPVAAKVRDERVWWSHGRLTDRLRAIPVDFPRLAKLESCGQTAGGQSIPFLQVGRGPRTLGLVGLMHGDGSGPELIVPALEHLLAHHPELFEKNRLLVLPAVNIDVRQRMVRGTPWLEQTNVNGVDLGRNFPAGWVGDAPGGGPRPASEPETRAVMAVLSEQPPDLLLSFGGTASICGLPAVGPASAAGDPGYVAHCRAVAGRYGRALFPDRKPAASWLKMAGPPGSLAAWLYHIGAGPALGLEGKLCPEAATFAADRTDFALLHDYQVRHVRALAAILNDWPR